MDDACAVVADQLHQPATLIDLSQRGARVLTTRTLGDPTDRVTLCFKGLFLHAEIRFHEVTPSGVATGLRLLPEGRVERAMLRHTLRDRLLDDADGNRTHVRLATRWKVDILSHEHCAGVVSDIALGGMGLHTDAPARAGERITVAFDPSLSDVPFVVSGVVQHATGGYVGITVDAANHQRFHDQMQACWELGDGV